MSSVHPDRNRQYSQGPNQPDEKASLTDGLTVRIQGPPEVIDEITELIRSSDEAEFIRVEQDDAGGIGADFILETVATVITIVSAVFFDKPIVPKIWGILHRHKGTKITIETPTQTLTIESTDNLSKESLQIALGALLQN